MKFGKSEKDITPHLLIAAIAAMLLYVATSWWAGSGESQQSAPAPSKAAQPVEPVAEAAKPEPPTAKAPDISIHKAAIDGNIEAVKQHLAAGADVNAKDDNGWTPLHEAAWHGRKEIVELLIANGADVNPQDVNGWTPLHHAARNGHKEIAELLIAKGADVDAKNEDGETPLDWAIRNEQTKIADLLRKRGGKTGEEVLAGESILGAVNIGDIKLVEQHLAAGADVNAKDSVRWTPLHHAAFEGYKEVAELLIAKGADVNATADTGATPLGLAYGATADLLRKHGGKTWKELEAEGK